MSETKKLIAISGITLAVYMGMKFLLPYVIPFLIAYLLVRLLNPATEKICRRLVWKKEVIVSVLLTALLVLGCFLIYLFYGMLTGQIRRIAMNFDYYSHCVCGFIDNCCLMVESHFGINVESVKAFIYTEIETATEQVRVYIVPEVVNYSVRYIKKLAHAGMFVLMLFVAIVLLIKDYDEIRERLGEYQLYRHFHNITERMWKHGGMYLKAQCMIIGVVIVLCTVALWLLGNPFFLVLGIVIGLLDALPFIGTGTVLIPMAVYQLFQKRFRLAFCYVGLFLLTYIVREFLEPRLIGKKLGIYPIVMLIVVYAGLYLFGTAGVVLGPVALLLIMEIWREINLSFTEKKK
ncbi:MAG: AI-2E family transporter [Lachnospiraceae bacterium]|nr:AI-2E family transporter [Lachnospiraceae bacterium]